MQHVKIFNEKFRKFFELNDENFDKNDLNRY